MKRTTSDLLDEYKHADLNKRLHLYLQYPELRPEFIETDRNEFRSGELDTTWNYFKFEFRKSDGHLAAAGYFKGALVSKKGLIPNTVADEIFAYDRGTCTLPPAVRSWIKSENNILEETIV